LPPIIGKVVNMKIERGKAETKYTKDIADIVMFSDTYKPREKDEGKFP